MHDVLLFSTPPCLLRCFAEPVFLAGIISENDQGKACPGVWG